MIVQFPYGDDAQPVILSFKDRRVSGHAGCNRYAAAISFGPQAGEVTVSRGMTTRMACETRRMEFEAAFIKAFEASRRYRLDGERLSFESEVAPPLEFLPPPLACRESPFLPASRHTISPRRTDATALSAATAKQPFSLRLAR